MTDNSRFMDLVSNLKQTIGVHQKSALKFVVRLDLLNKPGLCFRVGASPYSKIKRKQPFQRRDHQFGYIFFKNSHFLGS